MNICVYGASSDLIDKEFILQGEALGEEMARHGHSLVFGGGARGLMGAVARGVSRGNGKITGVAPSFFNVDGVLFDKCTEFITTSTMRERKQTMEDLSDAFIMTPGGIGTFEEFFEILTLKQLAQHNKPIAILNTDGYYDDILNLMNNAAEKGFMRNESLQLYQFFTDCKELLDYIENYSEAARDIFSLKNIK